MIERDLTQETETFLLGWALSLSTLDRSLNSGVSLSEHPFTQHCLLYVLALGSIHLHIFQMKIMIFTHKAVGNFR